MRLFFPVGFRPKSQQPGKSCFSKKSCQIARMKSFTRPCCLSWFLLNQPQFSGDVVEFIETFPKRKFLKRRAYCLEKFSLVLIIGSTRSGSSFICNQGFLLAVWPLLAINITLLPNKESCCKVVI